MTVIEFGIIGTLMNTCTFLLGWMLSRKKVSAEVKKTDSETEGNELYNVEKAVAIWRSLAESLEDKVAKLSSQVSALIEENKALRITIGHLEKTIERNS